MTTRKLIDSCILVYAYEKRDERKQKIASETLTGLVERGEAVVSMQNLAEFARVLTEKSAKPLPYNEVRQHVSEIADAVPVLPYGSKTVESALLLCAASRLHFFDALLAATMQENGIYETVTENVKDFAGIGWIKATNPFRK